MTQSSTVSPEDIIVTGVPLPPLHCRPAALDILKGFETGGLWDGTKVKLLPKGTPALLAYPDGPSKDAVWTIGWGATGKEIHKGVRWSLFDCETRFEADVRAVEASLRALLRGIHVSMGQFEALTLLAFNVGSPALAPSALMRAIRAGDEVGVEREWARWDHDHGQVVAGLTTRRALELAMWKEGVGK